MAFIAAIQHLAPLPRAVLVLRDVLGCSAKETARLLETTDASVNSALQRARAGLRESLPEHREEWQHAAEPTAAERELLARYVECSERADAEGLAALMHEDVRFSMPPTPGVWTGRSTVVQSWIDGGFGSEAFGSMRCVVTRANGQPAVAAYVRKPGDAAYEPLAIDVLRVQDGASPRSYLATDDAKELLAQAVAEALPVGNNRAFSVTTSSGTPDPYWWLRNKGVDVESEANSTLLRLTEALPDRPAPDGTQTQTAADDERALSALAIALQNLGQPSPSPLVVEYAQSQLLHGCVTLARRKSELVCAPAIVRAIIDLIEPHLEVSDGSSESAGKLRALAVEAALLLCAINKETAARLVPQIEPLLTDGVEGVRAAVADDIGRLWHFDKPALWRFAEHIAKHESSFAALRHFTAFLSRAVHSEPKKIEALIVDLIPRARSETDAHGDSIVEGIGNQVTILWLRYELAGSRELLDSWLKDLVAHASELNRAAATLRDIVVLGYEFGKEEDNRLRRNALRLARELVEATTAELQRYMAIDVASRTDHDHQAAREASRLLDNVDNQFYFSSGAFRANEKEKPTGLVTIESKKAFLDETEDILRRIGDVATPHTIYYLIDLLAYLRAVDPSRVFELASHALLNGGKLHGFQFESMGADRFVEIVGIFLADHREIFNDQARRELLIKCLDAFVEAGWPQARRLLYRLPELL